MNCLRDIFTFNHIDKSIDEAKLLEVKIFTDFITRSGGVTNKLITISNG